MLMVPWRFPLLILELKLLSYNSSRHLLFSYYLSGSQQQLHLEGKHTCMPALPTHWLLLVYLLFDSWQK